MFFTIFILNRKTLTINEFGRVAEWTIAPVLKTGAPQGAGGSNPSPSAILRKNAAEGRVQERHNSDVSRTARSVNL